MHRERLLSAALLMACGALAGCQPNVSSVGSWTDSGHYLEAENGVLSGGFEVGTDSSASAGRYLTPPAGVASEDAPGSARAIYDFSLRSPGTYYIWGRIRSPTANNNRFWVKVDDAEWTKWRISVGDIWYWDAFHDDANYGTALEYPLDAGPHTLTIANCVDGVDLDRLYYTPNANDEPPGNDTPCSPPHSIEINGACQLSCGIQGGNQCGSAACQGQPLLTAYDCDVCCEVAP